MFGFKKTKVELDKDTLINTSAGEKTIEELVNDLEAANATIAEQAEQIKDLQAKVEAAAAVETPAPQEEVQPTVETKPVEEPKPAEAAPAEAPEGTDAEFKKDLNNSLAATPKKIVVKVPNV